MNISPDFHAGAEWGYTATIYDYHHYYYKSSLGDRVSDKGSTYHLYSNAAFYGKAGVTLWKRHDLTMLVGMAGVSKRLSGVPMSFRYTYFTDGWNRDNMFFFGERGFFLGKDKQIRMNKFGTGMRFRLTPQKSLDIMLSGQICKNWRPDIYDAYSEQLVPVSNIHVRRDHYFGLNLTVGLNF